jgi:hypothetical protein
VFGILQHVRTSTTQKARALATPDSRRLGPIFVHYLYNANCEPQSKRSAPSAGANAYMTAYRCRGVVISFAPPTVNRASRIEFEGNQKPRHSARTAV